MNIKQEIKKLGYKIKYVPNNLIGKHIACYNVKYKNKIIKPKVTYDLDIPLNEIWISEQWKNKKENILIHELKEIKYRYEGYSGNQAHKKALKE